jgi:hypothetical protein
MAQNEKIRSKRYEKAAQLVADDRLLDEKRADAAADRGKVLHNPQPSRNQKRET